MITQQSVNELTIANEKRQNASLKLEVESLRKQVDSFAGVENGLSEEVQKLRNKLE
jgi:hypothetical protein